MKTELGEGCVQRSEADARTVPRAMTPPPPEGASPGPNVLADGVLAGRPGALEHWYRAEHPPVWRLCLGLLTDRTEADDAAQDAMLHLHDRLGSWDRTRSWESWRNTVVLNLCRDRLRRISARARAEGRAAARASEVAGSVVGAGLEQVEARELVVRTLRRLNEREREAVVLHDLEGRSTAEVALAMGISPGSVRSLLTLGRRRLRALLAPHAESADEGELDA